MATKKTENKDEDKSESSARTQQRANVRIHRAYTEAQYKAERYQFEIVKESGETTLPKPLSELNEVVALLPNKSRDEIVKEAEQMITEEQDFLRQRELKESWQRLGLSPEAAEVAAKVESRKRASLPPTIEWAGLLDKAFGRRR
jgi:hypothetical protein